MAMHFTPRARKHWTEVLAAAGGCVITAATRTGRSVDYVRRWRAEIYGAEKRCGSRSTLNQDQLNELIAAIHARIRQVDMAHRFGVTRRTLQNMITRYGCPRTRASRKRPI